MPAVPRVSVIVPNYNHHRFLPERLDSILGQTFRDFELLLLDDASTDGSLDVLRSYAERTGARLIVNDCNSGSPFHQWNRGVQEARGELVWIAESDDVATPELLARLVAELDRDPQHGLASCESLVIDETSRVIGPFSRDTFKNSADHWASDFTNDGRREIVEALYFSNTIISASGCVFRRQVYLDAGLADASYALAGDYLQWVKLLLRSSFCFVASPMNFTRVHTGTQRIATANDGRRELEILAAQKWMRGQMKFDKELVRAAASRQAVSWLQGVRAGRYSGPFHRHLSCFWGLFQASPRVALRFLGSFPYCLLAWFLKRTLFSRHDQPS